MGTLRNPLATPLRRGRHNAWVLVCVLLMPQWAFAAYDVYVAPKFLFRGLDPTMTVVGPLFDTPEQAFAWVQSVVPPTMTLANLRPMPSYGGIHTITFNGVYFHQLADQTVCNPTCSSTINDMVETHVVCPPDMTPLQINYPEWANRQMVCWGSSPYADEPPEDCDSCVGNPIYVGTGIKVQKETDYVGPSGLSYARTYRSKPGFFASATTAGFMDLSAPALSTSGHCYPASYLDPNTAAQVSKCFAYISSGQLKYRLATSTGRFIPFSGPNNAVVANADINDRVTRISTPGGDQWRVRRDDNSFELYALNGTLVSRVAHDGKTFSYQYSDATTPGGVAPRPGLLLSQADAFGHSLSWQYNSAGVATQMTDPGGGTYAYSYNAVGRLTGVAYPDSTGKTYHYNESANTSGTDQPRALTGITDESSVRYATYKYSTTGSAISTEHAGGVERYAVNGGTVIDPLGTNRSYSFNTILSYARDSSTTQPAASGSGTVMKYRVNDANGNPTQRVDFRGNKSCHAYDLTRNLETARLEGLASSASCPATISSYSVPAGTRQRKISTQWHPDWRLQVRVAEPRRLITYVYNGQPDPTNSNAITTCAPLAATLPEGSPIAVLCRKVEQETTDATGTLGFGATLGTVVRSWDYTYDSFGHVLTADGPRTDVSDVTTYTYYSCTTGYQCGQIQTITNAAGHVTTFNTYNAHGQPLTITDPNGLVTTLTYDLRQRLTSRTVSGEQTTFEYWPTGLLKKTTLPDSGFISYTYDAAHRLTGVTDSDGNYITYTLDNMGNRTAEQVFDPSSALTQTRTRVFNNLNRLWKELGAAGTANVTTTFGYDNNGNQTTINAPLSRNTSETYDELNRMTQVTDPLSGVTQYGYNALDQLISVTDPRSKVTSYTYNGLGDLTQQVSPDTGTTANTYDSGGNLQTSTDARSKTGTYAYDALNRVTSLTYPDQTLTYTYDSGSNQKGRLTQVTDNSGSTSWTYDTQGRVLSRQQTMGSVSKTVGYAYDASGRIQTLTLPSGNAITYGYSNGRIASLTLNGSTTILSNVLYQPFGPTRGWTWGNSTLAVREYDTDGKITDIDSAGLKTYGYDDAFRITGITDASDPDLSQTYNYDLLDRLTSATGTGLNQGWSYDANGNRLTQTGSQSSTFTISSTSNRLSSITGSLTRTYSYDSAGNTTNDGTATLTYSDAGTMVSATKAGITTTYALNALGQRIRKTTSSASTYFAYDEAGHLVGEYDNAGNLTQETIWFGGIPVATIRPNGGGGVNLFYVHTDQLTTPRRVSRPSDNAIVWRWDSDPFGVTLANEDPDGDSTSFAYGLRFPGQYRDAETGLNYNNLRNYDPSTARYIESDPIGIAGGLNTYRYAMAAPLGYYDFLGLEPECTPWRRIDQSTKQRESERRYAVGDEAPGLSSDLDSTNVLGFGESPNPRSLFDRSPPLTPGGGLRFNWNETRVQRWLIQPIVEYWDVITETRACAECIDGKVRSWTDRRTFREDRPDLTRDVGPPRYEYSSRDIGPGKDHVLP